MGNPDRPKKSKMGFAVPVGQWIRGPLREWAESLLSSVALERHGLLEPSVVRRLWNAHVSGEQDRETGVWDVLMLQAWLEEHA